MSYINKCAKNELLQNYINYINNKCIEKMPIVKNKKKITDKIIIPTTKSYNELIYNNYNLDQLKMIAKIYKIKLNGKKEELINKIYCFLYLSSHIINIQKIIRGNFVRKYISLHGPASLNRNICTNNTDFITMDPLNEISFHQFVSYKDKDGFIYGFDINSLHNLLLKKGVNSSNPYNRNLFPQNMFDNIKKIHTLSKILNIPLNLIYEDDTQKVSYEKSIELRIISLFQNIDNLGNYSNANWFFSLNRTELLRFVRELIDIWNFRAQLTSSIKRVICPPNGNPFINININVMMNTENIWTIRKIIIEVMEKLVNTGIDNEYKSLGAYYILGALTLVNNEAAIAMSWLYQSFNYSDIY